MELYFISLFLLLGLCLGSFYNVVGLRVPLRESIAFPPSHCPNCNHKLAWYELLPVLSYVCLGAKCKVCKQKISPIYPFFELVTGVLFVLAYLQVGLSVELIFSLILISMLVIISVSDIHTQLIPNRILIFFAIILIPFAVVLDETTLVEQGVGLLAAFGINLLVLLLSKGKGMGGGDVKLFMLLGLVLGVKMFLVLFFLSALVGMIFAVPAKLLKNKNVIPYGPSISIATIITMFYGSEVLNWYLRMFV